MEAMEFKIGDTVKGIRAGIFRIKGFRTAGGSDGADLIPVNPETLMPGKHPAMFLPLDCIRPIDAQSTVRHKDGLVTFA